jgi:curli biogenesis system outer membrane secretion channel CsgG
MRLAALVALLAVAYPAHAAGDAPTAAVLYFDYDGKDAELALLRKGLAQMLISDLTGNESIRVVERERLQDVLAELKLQASSRIDQASAVKAGKLLGARYLVLGAYFDVMKSFRADARIVDVETGQVLFSAGGTAKPDDVLVLEQKLAGDLGRYFSTNLPKAKTHPVRRALKQPATLPSRTLIEYGRALEAYDAGDKQKAKDSLSKVLKDQPEFQLATLDLDKIMK